MILQLSFVTLSPRTGRAAGHVSGLDRVGFPVSVPPATYCKMTEITESALTFNHRFEPAPRVVELDPRVVPQGHYMPLPEHQTRTDLTAAQM